MDERPSARLQRMGLSLPAVPAPVAAYVPAVVAGNWCYTSGQLPFADGRLTAVGRVGAEVPLAEAYRAARQAALNALAAAAAAAGGLDRLVRVIKVTGFVQAAPGFTAEAQVVNGASELLGEVFGEAGRHARSAVGVLALPLNAAVEIECLFQVQA
ncbi:YjgF_endoribonc domain-containing protein [Candidatus Hydrogenisulfobacillus filiaventi]|uniref:YjgF_endoribonc domain-containing protein n=1 Tax=Candidatus Hydrogenisulfobacillus filiaventi TaxID=2707344 RepID=A0A6F8ZG06_9FIRM|nr:RidA family protein [Bacillota bacterium]CAB1128710.1 YjgF_endoribonc domain-containing protein [Candidatus Hydrogenisulfobacillus filiaventi]